MTGLNTFVTNCYIIHTIMPLSISIMTKRYSIHLDTVSIEKQSEIISKVIQKILVAKQVEGQHRSISLQEIYSHMNKITKIMKERKAVIYEQLNGIDSSEQIFDIFEMDPRETWTYNK